MSSCSGTSCPQMGAPPPAMHFPHIDLPAACDTSMAGAVAPVTPGCAAAAAAAAAAAGGDAVNGQHHLLRHVLSPEQCSDALRHFGTKDSKAAARMVNRMSQRELRDMFAKVYNVHTNSNNNTWLRRKLLEAVGASRRFYAAANKTGRPKPRRSAAGNEGAHHNSGAARPRAPKTPTTATAAAAGASAAAAAGAAGGHTASVTALHFQQQQAHQQQYQHQQFHLAVAPGPALPAGSPRALSQRRRRCGPAGGGTELHQWGCGGGGTAACASTAHQRHYLQPFAPQHSSEAGETTTCSEGSDTHPRALAPHYSLAGGDSASGTPTSAFAASQQHVPAMPSNGSNSSLQSSQFAAAALQPAPQRLPSLGLGLGSFGSGPLAGGAPLAVSADGKLPHISSFGTLAALLGGGPSPSEAAAAAAAAAATGQDAAAAQQLAVLQAMPSVDLGPWGCADVGGSSLAPAPTMIAPLDPSGKGGPMEEDWLTWDDWQLPALF